MLNKPMETPLPTNKRILYVITKSNFGGAQKYVYELATEMRNKGYEVAVACGDKGELIDKLQQANIQTFIITSFQRDINFIKEVKVIISLFKIMYRYKPDIIHLNSAKAGGLGSVIGRILRIKKIVFTAHGWSFLEPRTKLWKTMAWAGSYLTSLFSHNIITVSHYDFLHMRMFGTKKKTSVIHTAMNHFLFLPREEARQKIFDQQIIEQHRSNLWLVTIAELNHNKNHTTAIDAVAEFNQTHTNKIFYTIIGSGELLQNLKEQVSLKGLDEYVYFLDYVENAKQYLLAFDIFLLPSKKEGLPYALLEAGLAEIPCVASAVGGIPEVITDKKSGLLINPNNHTTIVEALEFLINYPDQRTLFSYNLRDTIIDNFNLKNMVEKTESIYNTN